MALFRCVPAVFVLLLTLLGISAGLRLPRCAAATSKQGSLPIRVAVLQELLRAPLARISQAELAELKLELSEMQQLLVDPGELVEVCEHPHGPHYVPKAMRGFSA